MSLQVYVTSALFERDLNPTYGMSPRYVINYKNVKRQSYAARDGGKTPKWDQQFTFNVGTDMATAGVLSFTFLESDDMIAQA